MTVLMMIGGFALLYVGAEFLIRGGAALALRLGLTPLVVGLTVVAFGTSSPELVVSLQAALAGSGSLAIGNVVGSNICNVALILGIAALIRPIQVQAQIIRLDVPIVILCSGLLLLLLLDDDLGRIEGGGLLLGIVTYVLFSVRMARREQRAVQEEFAESMPVPQRSAWLDGLFVLGGLAVLITGADLFVEGAVALARIFGLSEAVIGLTIVAVGTSLPELATSILAALKDEGDIALGNAIGSNIFNILCILGTTSLVHPLRTGEVGLTDLGMMTALVVLLLPLMRTGFCLNRWEGALLLVIYTGYLGYLLLGA